MNEIMITTRRNTLGFSRDQVAATNRAVVQGDDPWTIRVMETDGDDAQVVVRLGDGHTTVRSDGRVVVRGASDE